LWWMRLRGEDAAVLIIASLVATGLFVPAIHAADNRGRIFDTGSQSPFSNYSLHNGTLPNVSMQTGYETTPPPITIYRFERDLASLPGPRDLAYGPSVITFTIDPRLLAGLVAICAIIAGVWYLLPHNEEDTKEK
jgi:hypothetical protein